eukprot:7043733-Prymnesium_polylepis.1
MAAQLRQEIVNALRHLSDRPANKSAAREMHARAAHCSSCIGIERECRVRFLFRALWFSLISTPSPASSPCFSQSITQSAARP